MQFFKVPWFDFVNSQLLLLLLKYSALSRCSISAFFSPTLSLYFPRHLAIPETQQAHPSLKTSPWGSSPPSYPSPSHCRATSRGCHLWGCQHTRHPLWPHCSLQYARCPQELNGTATLCKDRHKCHLFEEATLLSII